jgi:hypothetical protein
LEPVAATESIAPIGRCERRPEIIARRLPDRTVLLNGTTGGCFELNPVGSTIWDALDGVRSWTEIAAEVSRRFQCSLASAERDVQSFAAALVQAELIRPVNDAQP